MPSKPQADFYVRLVGQGVRPRNIPMRALARVLDAVQRLVEQKIEDSDDNPATQIVKQEDSRTLHLVEVKTGSAAYAVCAPDRKAMLSVLSEVGASISDPDNSDWTDTTVSSIKDLSEVAKSQGVEIEFCEPPKEKGVRFGNVIAKITPITYNTIRTSAFITGEASVYAQIERVGGATKMHCGIRLPESPRKMIICGVANEKLIRELGRHIYKHVFLHGKARWLRHNWSLKRLFVQSFDRPKEGSITEALRKIHKAGGHVWDEIADPDTMIAEIRGE